LAEAIISPDTSRNDLLKVAGAGVLSGILTPLMVPLIDRISGTPGDFRIALVAIPFAVLVFILIRRLSANPWWAAWIAALVTMIAFVAAVNAAIFIDGQADNAAKAARNVLSGLAGGFVGAGLMALGIALLPAGPRDAAAWLPMLATGTVAGALLALDNALDLDLASVLYPVAGRRRGHAGAGLAAGEAFLSAATPGSPGQPHGDLSSAQPSCPLRHLIEKAGDALDPPVADDRKIRALDRSVGAVGAEAPGEADVVAKTVGAAEQLKPEIRKTLLHAGDQGVDAVVTVAAHQGVDVAGTAGPVFAEDGAAAARRPLVPQLDIAAGNGIDVGHVCAPSISAG
jgi:hypothetical protein